MAIYIFTYNRPLKLERIFLDMNSIPGEYDIYIIDDSSQEDVIKTNKKISKTFNTVKYLGLYNKPTSTPRLSGES